MIDLKKDVIEYNLKLSQFKTQLGEQKSSSAVSNNRTKCPKCGHTEFTPVRKKWSIMTGFMTNKVELICNNCGTKVQK